MPEESIQPQGNTHHQPAIAFERRLVQGKVCASAYNLIRRDYCNQTAFVKPPLCCCVCEEKREKWGQAKKHSRAKRAHARNTQTHIHTHTHTHTHKYAHNKTNIFLWKMWSVWCGRGSFRRKKIRRKHFVEKNSSKKNSSKKSYEKLYQKTAKLGIPGLGLEDRLSKPATERLRVKP